MRTIINANPLSFKLVKVADIIPQTPFYMLVKCRILVSRVNINHIFTTSSSSNIENDDEINLLNDIEMNNAEEESLISMQANNNIRILHFHSQRNNEVIHGGSNPGH